MLGFGNISKGWNWLKFEDSNVGYQQYVLDQENPDDYIHNIGVQFAPVAEESFVVTDTFFGTKLQAGDTIFIFDPEYYGYTLFEYGEIDDGVMGFTVMTADAEQGNPITSLTLKKGDNVLFMPADLSSSPSVAGEVQSSGEATLTFTVTEDDYIFPITNPFPKSTTLADLTCLESGDTIFVWDSVYYGYTLLEYAEVEDGVMGFTVMTADAEQGEPITDTSYVVFGVGQGGLYMPTDSRTWKVTYNYNSAK